MDEWGTSGKKRPTVKLLLDYLIEAELYRAADYVAVQLLNGSYQENNSKLFSLLKDLFDFINFVTETPPERPKQGPKRRVSIGEITDINRVETAYSNSLGSVYNKITMQCYGSDTYDESTINEIFLGEAVSNAKGREINGRAHK